MGEGWGWIFSGGGAFIRDLRVLDTGVKNKRALIQLLNFFQGAYWMWGLKRCCAFIEIFMV